MIVELRYFRVTCEHCPTKINVAARNLFDLRNEVLPMFKWQAKVGGYALCPKCVGGVDK